MNLSHRQQAVAQVFSDDTPERVSVTQHGNTISVEVENMYEHVNLTFARLLALSEIFGTKEFKVNNWSSSGCETCDYGSKYVQEFSYNVVA